MRLVVQNYHESLVSILDIAMKYRKEQGQINTESVVLLTGIINSLKEIIVFIKNRFGRFLKSSLKVPLSEHQVSKQQMQSKLDLLKARFSKGTVDTALSEILIRHFERYIVKKSFGTFHIISYNKKLISKLINLDDSNGIENSKITSLLLDMNFNTNAFIDYLTESIAKRLVAIKDDIGKIELLQIELLEINHKDGTRRVKFHRGDSSVLQVVKKWIHDEIAFLNEKLDLQHKFLNKKVPEAPLPKLVCNLSSDQISIFLRALDEAKIVHAKSLNEVFKVIVPFLSTSYKNELSPGSVRSKSYTIEERDKDVVLEALEKVIGKIRKY